VEVPPLPPFLAVRERTGRHRPQLGDFFARLLEKSRATAGVPISVTFSVEASHGPFGD
jgi:hypothetical protein